MMAQQKGFAVGCFVAGILATPIATLLAFMSAGAGHGGYEFARLFFPYSMLLTLIADDTITIPLIVLALAQFSIYGLLLGGDCSRWAVALLDNLNRYRHHSFCGCSGLLFRLTS
jgi:ABC-type glycerol-3-phosphate transport system permease component